VARKSKSIVRTFKLTIRVDSDVAEKYPNFRYNWTDPEDFAEYLAENIARDGEDDNGAHSYGYSIAVRPL
jgi:hypothetical protein